MSDLFIGEILVLVLLLPVLFRPFFRRLQRIEGIPFLPLLSLFFCILIIAGAGLRISLLPVFAFCVLMFLFGLPRLVRLFRKLPTDWYSPTSLVLSCLLMVIMIGSFWFSCRYIPELPYIPASSVTVSGVTKEVSPGVSARFTVWEPAATTGRKVVVLAGNSFSPFRKTTALILAENGWTVIAGDFFGYRDYDNKLLSVPIIQRFLAVSGVMLSGSPFLTDAGETAQVLSAYVSRLIRFAHEEYGAFIPLYAVAEGNGCEPAFELMSGSSDSLAGLVCVMTSADSSSLPVNTALPVIGSDTAGMMPSAAGSYPVFSLTGDDSSLYGFGELGADDVLAAELLGSSRDAGRKQAELTAQRINTWLSMRRVFRENK